MSRWPDCGEAAYCTAIEGHVDAIQHAPSAGGHCVPRTFAHDGIWIELSPALLRHLTNPVYIRRIMREQQFRHRCMAALVMQQRIVQRFVMAECARNRAQSAHVLRMLPASVMPAA